MRRRRREVILPPVVALEELADRRLGTDNAVFLNGAVIIIEERTVEAAPVGEDEGGGEG